YGKVLRQVLDDPVVDTAIVLFIPPLVTNASDVAAELIRACDPPPTKPVLTCFVGTQGIPDVLRGAVSIPSYTYPESAARALGHASRRSSWLRRPVGSVPEFANLDRPLARTIVDEALRRDQRPWLTQAEVSGLLRAYGIIRPGELIVHSAEEAADAVTQLGAPVAVKLVSDTVIHKSDVGGVRLNLDAPSSAAAAYRAMADALIASGRPEAMQGALVQKMIAGGVECIVGVVTDPVFGPLIAFGLGGVAAEVLGDVAFRLHPLTDIDADELIASSKAARLLAGFRGAPAADMGALRDVLLRVSKLVDDVPEVAELDLNPVVVRPAGDGAYTLDARIRLGPPA
ncbi:MAG TPA: acetate--CoA ligase family protein, partial [Chloroflexota bacterium]|nr:acetate--CoA ligase family protein [Chloroflexota bacterium]